MYIIQTESTKQIINY